MDLSEHVIIEEQAVKISWIPASDQPIYDSIYNITQVYGLCFDDNDRILIFKSAKGHWTLPGGTPEANETVIETLIRELQEEVSIQVKDNPIF